MSNEDCAPEYCLKPILIVGCGNISLGDDGFSPHVVGALCQHLPIPEGIAVLTVGAAAGEIPLDIALSAKNPKWIVLVDVLDCGQQTGTISILHLASLPRNANDIFSFPQEPTAGLLRQCKAVGAEVFLDSVQPEIIPDYASVGLSTSAQKAVSRACDYIVESLY